MEEVEELLNKALRYRRLAREMTDRKTAYILNVMADELEAKAVAEQKEEPRPERAAKSETS